MRADRLLSMVLLLQTRGKMTAEALAEELMVSRRTILRDMEALSLAGIPIYAEGGHGGGIALDENYRTSLTGFNEAEVRSLFVANYAQRLKDVGLGEAAESTFLKLLSALPPAHQQSVEHIRQRILIDPDWWWHDAHPMPFWDDLLQAVYADQCIAVVYENYQGELITRILEPYSLVAKSSLWYLVARRNGEFRTYRVSRFQQIDLLDQHFQRQPDFDLPTYWRQHLQEFPENLAGYHFTLRIHPDRVSFAKWLATGRYQIIETHTDGWISLRFQFESIELAKMLVFGLGSQASVIEPPELLKAVLDTAGEIIEHHQGNPD